MAQSPVDSSIKKYEKYFIKEVKTKEECRLYYFMYDHIEKNEVITMKDNLHNNLMR